MAGRKICHLRALEHVRAHGGRHGRAGVDHPVVAGVAQVNTRKSQAGHFSVADLWPFVAVLGVVLGGGGGYLLYFAWLLKAGA